MKTATLKAAMSGASPASRPGSFSSCPGSSDKMLIFVEVTLTSPLIIKKHNSVVEGEFFFLSLKKSR